MEENRTTAGKMPLRNAVCCFLGALIWGTAFVAQRIGSDEIPVSEPYLWSKGVGAKVRVREEKNPDRRLRPRNTG